jgi:hypothetical protein
MKRNTYLNYKFGVFHMDQGFEWRIFCPQISHLCMNSSYLSQFLLKPAAGNTAPISLEEIDAMASRSGIHYTL